MLRQRPLALAVLTASVVVAACDSVKGAIGSHVDTVAKAGSQELTVERLAKLLGESQVPLAGPQGREVARTLSASGPTTSSSAPPPPAATRSTTPRRSTTRCGR
jgi:predicted small secreted protein